MIFCLSDGAVQCRLRVFENRVLRIFGPKRDEVKWDLRRLHNTELYDLYSSLNIQVIKSRRLRSLEHVAGMGERRGSYRVLVGKTEGRNHLEDPGVDGRILLKWIFQKWDRGAWTGSIWFKRGTGDRLLIMR